MGLESGLGLFRISCLTSINSVNLSEFQLPPQPNVDSDASVTGLL